MELHSVAKIGTHYDLVAISDGTGLYAIGPD
jgi:hypothetical protein